MGSPQARRRTVAGPLAGPPLIGLCLAGAALRFGTLATQSFWYDEAATWQLVRRSFGGMLRAIPGHESTPPLYYVLEWLWARLAGTGEVGLRSLSALIGTLTIALVYAAARRPLTRRGALAAAALTCFNPLLIWYSQEARAYALLVALAAASLWALGAALDDEEGRRHVLVWALVGALAIATHYFAVFLIVPEALWLARARGRSALPALAGVAVAGCALLPLALHQRDINGAAFIGASSLATRFVQAAKQLVVGYDAPGELVLSLVGAALVVALVARASTRGLPYLALALAAVAVPVALALAGLDYLIARNLLAAWVPVAVVFGAAAVTPGRAGPALIAALCLVGLVAYAGVELDVRYQRDDWRDAARAVPAAGPAAVVVTPGSGSLPLAYYLPASRPLPPSGAAVASVEVLRLGTREVGKPVDAPPVTAPPAPLAGFAAPLLERHRTFDVVRYRALGTPVVVTPATLESPGAAVLVDR